VLPGLDSDRDPVTGEPLFPQPQPEC
jgi:hypothetical protein